jgi:hypothetical protein
LRRRAARHCGRLPLDAEAVSAAGAGRRRQGALGGPAGCTRVKSGLVFPMRYRGTVRCQRYERRLYSEFAGILQAEIRQRAFGVCMLISSFCAGSSISILV